MGDFNMVFILKTVVIGQPIPNSTVTKYFLLSHIIRLNLIIKGQHVIWSNKVIGVQRIICKLDRVGWSKSRLDFLFILLIQKHGFFH